MCQDIIYQTSTKSYCTCAQFDLIRNVSLETLRRWSNAAQKDYAEMMTKLYMSEGIDFTKMARDSDLLSAIEDEMNCREQRAAITHPDPDLRIIEDRQRIHDVSTPYDSWDDDEYISDNSDDESQEETVYDPNIYGYCF
jgi:hypothetical protein